MSKIREYTMYVKLPLPTDPDAEDGDQENVLRICEAMSAAGIDGDDWEFGDTNDVEVD